MIKVSRIYTDNETIRLLEKEYTDYNAKERRAFYFNEEALNNFRDRMQKRRESDTIGQLELVIKYGYVSQHWR